MEIFSSSELGRLMQKQTGPVVSIYMPSHRTGDNQQDPIRLRNLLREAENRLTAYGLRAGATRQLLEPAAKLVSDGGFWQHQGDGLALFAAAGLFLYYRLPQTFDELVTVGERFHIKPLISLLAEDALFYLLAISQKRVRLLQCTRFSEHEVVLEGVPGSLAEAVRYDDPEKQLQYHSAGGDGAIYHGQGVGETYEKDAILRYFQQVDRGLQKLLQTGHTPLVLAAVDYLHAIYRRANGYRYLLQTGLEGNTDEMSSSTLRERGWAIISPVLESAREEALALYHDAVGTGASASELEDVVLAARDGRIAVLFLASGTARWGRFEEGGRKITLSDEKTNWDEDLMDTAAFLTLAGGGSVYTLEPEKMPGRAALAALLRY